MQPSNRRKSKRFPATPVEIHVTGPNGPVSGTLVDVCQGGARIDGIPLEASQGTLDCTFAGSNTNQKCRCVPGDYPGLMRGIALSPPLTREAVASLIDLDKVRAPDDDRRELELAEGDRSEVNQEIRAIQNCRSSLFISTIGGVAAAATTTVTFWFKDKLPWSWPLAGGFIAFVLLTIGTLALIEKARAINIRRGFLAALDQHLSRGTLPARYSGWSHLLHAYEECGAIHKHNLLIGRKRATVRRESDCRTKGNNEAIQFLSCKSVLPAFVDSFTSYSAWVLGILYALVCVGCTVSLWMWVSTVVPQPGVPSLVAVVEIACFAALAQRLGYHLRSIRKGSHSYEACYRAFLLMLGPDCGCRIDRVFQHP